jgi:hypothetical protein
MTKRGSAGFAANSAIWKPATSRRVESGEFLPSDRVADSNRYHLQWRHQQFIDQNWSANWNTSGFPTTAISPTCPARSTRPPASTCRVRAAWLQRRLVAGHGMCRVSRPCRIRMPPLSSPTAVCRRSSLAASRENLSRQPIQRCRRPLRFQRRTGLLRSPCWEPRAGGAFSRQSHLQLPAANALFGCHAAPGLVSQPLRAGRCHAEPVGQHGNTPAGGFASTTRSLPMFSLDSSLILERDWTFLGANYTQTLEPRAYYVYIPYKDQSADSGVRQQFPRTLAGPVVCREPVHRRGPHQRRQPVDAGGHVAIPRPGQRRRNACRSPLASATTLMTSACRSPVPPAPPKHRNCLPRPAVRSRRVALERRHPVQYRGRRIDQGQPGRRLA